MPAIGRGNLSLRAFPFPYKAAMAICSDIDGTTTLERFLAIQQFLNTKHITLMGPGIDLEIGNSFFPYTIDDSFAYFSSRPADRALIKNLIEAGYIDCLHSFGDGIHSRANVLRALDELKRDVCQLDVWVDHAYAPSNLGKYPTQGTGDVPGSSIYHADATLDYGIKFVWKGRVSSIVGHDVPFTGSSFKCIFDKNHSSHTIANIAKELAKTFLARAGNRRFAIHSQNQLLSMACLQDGQRIYEFKRCNNHWRGLGRGVDSYGLAYVIRRKALDDLIASTGYMIVYTHIGVGPHQPPPIPPATQNALRGLAEAYRAGDIYVTTTSRLLNYYLNRRYLNFSHEVDGKGLTRIMIQSVSDPVFGTRLPTVEELQGITFYVSDRRKVQVYLGDKQVIPIERNPADHTGQESVMIPRTFLTYPLLKKS